MATQGVPMPARATVRLEDRDGWLFVTVFPEDPELLERETPGG